MASAAHTGEADIVRRVVQGLVDELHPDPTQRPTVQPRSRLDRDLGLDSLARAELFDRLERALDLRLSEALFVRVETLADLARELHGAPPRTDVEPGTASLPATEISDAGEQRERSPDALLEMQSLVDVLRWHAREHPERTHAVLLGDDGAPARRLSYGELLSGATRIACGLLERGVEPADRVALMLPTGADYLASFFAPLLIGAVPVPLYPPGRPAQLAEHLSRQAGILRNAGATALISAPEVLPFARLLASQSLRCIASPAELARDGELPALAASPEDVALLQYTSGSTGDPKGVVLSHHNLLSNVAAMGRVVQATQRDVMVSWLPLYHDMGLIGGWLSPLCLGFVTVLMSPLAFLTRPASWLRAIHEHHGTLSAAPNFGYERCAHAVRDEDITGVDLSCWRYALNGSEPVSPRTVERFCARFARYGFRADAMAPAYGLAECSVGLTFPPPGRGAIIDRIERAAFAHRGVAIRATATGDPEAAQEVVACGPPLPGHEVRTVDAAGRELAERREGMIEFRGPSATRGYFGAAEQTRTLLHGDWLRSGDLGYLAQGDLYVTGRLKDVIIRAGQHVHPQDLEAAVGELPGVRMGCVVAFASPDPQAATERLIVLAETRLRAPPELARLRADIVGLVTDLLGTPPDDVRVLPPHGVLKTSSGKLRRAACRAAYEAGSLGRAPQSPSWQLLRLEWIALRARCTRAVRATTDALYAAYVVCITAVVVVLAWLLVAISPARLAWGIANTAARLLLRGAAIPFTVEGLAHLPDAGAVLVCNHQSDIDGLVLIAALPRRVTIVAKAELSRSVWTRLPLRRLGVQFVERERALESLAAGSKLAALASEGQPLLFFPEGTHTRVPGLLPFHSGAFLVAAGAGLPLLPMALTGTREVLRPGTHLPRRAPITLAVGAPITASGTNWPAAMALRAQARAFMLRQTGEPDRPLPSRDSRRPTRA